MQMGEKNTVKITPVAVDLRGAADAIIGAEAWKNEAITIDYRASWGRTRTAPLSGMSCGRSHSEEVVGSTVWSTLECSRSTGAVTRGRSRRTTCQPTDSEYAAWTGSLL